MTTAWFDPNMYAWIPGTLLGVMGGMEGAFVGICASRGKCKKLVLSFHFGIMGACLVLMIAGVVALVTGQPYGVWYGIGFPGILVLVILGSLTPVVLKRYQEAELRNSAKDI